MTFDKKSEWYLSHYSVCISETVRRFPDIVGKSMLEMEQVTEKLRR
jgi:hypothetical protein